MYDYNTARERSMVLEQSQVQAQSVFLAKVFNWMFVGLLLTAGSAFLTANSRAALEFIFGNRLVFYGLIFAELGVVFTLASRVEKLSAGTATLLFLGYSVLNGVTLSAILMVYTMTSIAVTFLVTAGMFGVMAIYGFVTKKDLTSLGSFLFMGLIGIIIAAVVNFFVGSSMISWVISGIGVIVFTGLTAYDVQRLSRIGASGIMTGGEAAIRKGSLLGALTLYLDFINLFLMLLHFLGGGRK
ncbi:MAG: Bax inhibitor-1/YccA family protein [Deltaproteobacteria bacterium]